MKQCYALVACMMLAACDSTPTADSIESKVSGLVHFAGRQADIVGQNNINGLVPIAAMSGNQGRYGLGAYEGLDGEITIFEGRPYVTQIRDGGFIMRHDTDGAAIFAAWTNHDTWRDEPIPAEVSSFVDLQRYIRTRAIAAGIDTHATAFPFLIAGRAAELEWHINVDRTQGQTVTRELFQASKDNFVMRDEPVTIVGFYSELHHGTFIGTYAPAMADSGEQSALHLHLISDDGKSAGHIDNLRFNGGMTLRLPQ
jgi:acetolactate decarboxylase